VQRVCSVLAALTRELYEMPEQATPPTMRSVGQSVEFIGTLLKHSGLDEKVNLAQLRAFAVDDDLGVLDAVCESLSAAGVDAITTESAGAALAELAGSSYDLVILDVNLPELDGLELCSHLREMELHATTPVIFITGHASLENRVQFSLRGGSELLIKPFNLLDLALRSLSLIIKDKLKKA
jgi:CheY-like chemotaxis protein